MNKVGKAKDGGIIDFHIHLFPDRIAARALKKISGEIGISTGELHSDATAEGTERILVPLGIEMAAVCNIAVTPDRERAVNSFAISLLEDPFFIPLGSLHPKSNEKEREAERLFCAGIKGVKLHPDFMNVPLSDGGYEEIFRILSEMKMFVLIHAGYNPFKEEKPLSTPEMIAKIKEKFANLTIIAAHLGGFGMAERSIRSLFGSGVYLDTSLSSMREEDAKEVICGFGEDFILFGSDTPWSDPVKELSFVRNLSISESARRKILSENARSLIL